MVISIHPLLTVLVIGYVGLSHGSHVITSKGSQVSVLTLNDVKVNYGRSIALTRDHLNILHDPDDHCEVSVIENDPSSSRIGTIIPSTFQCQFQQGEIFYQHFGSLSQMVDVVKLQVRLYSKMKTIVKPFMIKANVMFDKPLEILNKVENLIVEELGGLSDPIGPEVLSFNFNKEQKVCKVRLDSQHGGPPYYGAIVNTSVVTIGLTTNQIIGYKYVNCKDFLSGSLRYAHNREGRSANRDYVPLVIEVFDKTSTSIEKREFVQMPVRIKRAPENHPPIVNYNVASYSLQVDQLMITALTSQIMRAEDRETDAGDIIFNVTHKYRKNEGYLVHTDDPTRPLTTFYQREIDELKIAYKPPPQLSTVQRLQQIWFEAKDSQGSASTPFYVIFVIKPMNTYAPIVNKNMGLAMFEGQSREITRQVLEVRDPDNEEKVTISVAAGLFHGRLEKNNKVVYSFSVADIDKGTVRYMHDDSDTFSDSVVFRVSDGFNYMAVMFVITIIPTDDQPPTVAYNTGIVLDEGGLKNIDQFDLSATDVDSDDMKIQFGIVKSPTAGYLCERSLTKEQLDTSGNKISPEDWKLVDGVYERKINKFSQVNIVLGKVFYKHSGDEVYRDEFTFRVYDNAKFPNQSGLKKFFIDLIPVDDQFPVKDFMSSLTMKALETETTIVTNKALKYSDVDSVDSKLLYSITEGPFYDLPGNNAGYFVLSDNKETEIKQFTQHHVNHFKVLYEPAQSEIGIKSKTTLVRFHVSDPAGNTLDNQELTIEVLPVNSQPPTPVEGVLTLKEGDKKVITSTNLDALDADTLDHELFFSLVQTPRHGAVTLDDAKLSPGSSVKLVDIRSNLVYYLHDGSETTVDTVNLMLSDGLHNVPVSLPIVIEPVDDMLTKVEMMKTSLSTLEGGAVPVDSSLIDVKDEDTEVDEIIVQVNRKPHFGRIERNGRGVNSFSLSEMKAGTIKYRHTSGDVGPIQQLDTFTFVLANANNTNELLIDGDLYKEIEVNVQLNVVNNQPPYISGSFLLAVEEGGECLFTPDVLNVTDADTLTNNIFCHLTKKPKYGYLQSVSPEKGSEKSRKGIKLEKFNALDLNTRVIGYSQNKHKGIEPTRDTLRLVCSDGVNPSPQITVNIQIQPVNDEVPIVFTQQNIVCVEDDLILFNLGKINPYDRDVPADPLQVKITRQPKNGDILLQTLTGARRVTSFDKAALMADSENSLIYQHKGTETTEDSFEIEVTDGIHNATKEIQMTIISMDDETPRLTSNTGLYMDRGETKVITRDNLQASDLDSDNAGLMYVVMMKPMIGKLQKVFPYDRLLDLKDGDNFTQKDIDERRIRYTHLEDTTAERDVIRLDVTDGYNRLINQMFNIMVTSIDIVFPTVVSKGVSLIENNRAIITTDLLSASDSNSPDEKLIFTITKAPLKGHLENVDFSGIPIVSFKQIDLASNKIVYIHTSTDEIKLDNFEFEVTDGRNKLFRTFRLKLDDVNNKIPVLKVTTIEAIQHLSTIVTPFEMKISDNDTESDQLAFRITEPPRFGSFLHDGTNKVLKFTQQEVEENRISYKQDGSESSFDKFAMTVTDGKHEDFYVHPNLKTSTSKPVVVNIRIEKMDKEAPTLKHNTGASSLKQRQKNRVFKFSPKNLLAVDSSAGMDAVWFSIRQKPTHGGIFHVRNKRKTLIKFSQEDINKRDIVYILNEDSKATKDMFIFDVYDDKKNMLRGQTFYLNWAWIELVEREYLVNETDTEVVLTLQRRGYLQETSFASVVVVNDTAVENVHLSTQKRHFVQFNLGQNKTTYKIRILDDSKHDKSKKFQVFLNNGIQALIGSNDKATVTINDPEDEPRVGFESFKVSIEESLGSVDLHLRRFGDSSDVSKVICITNSDTAKGTTEGKVESNKDYISKEENDHHSIVTFKKNSTKATCSVKIIDDSLFEDEETFNVLLKPYYASSIVEDKREINVAILKDPADEPVFSFESPTYNVREDVGYVDVNVLREGTDLSIKSYVLFATSQQIPPSAKANLDYKPLVTMIEFNNEQRKVTLKVRIVDDTGRPRIEGLESFDVYLKTPRNGRLSHPSKTVISIDDRQTDKPTVYFEKSHYSVIEGERNVSINIERAGDLAHESYVRCFTRQISAHVSEDFIERPNVNSSRVFFKRGQYQATCVVAIRDDKLYEPREQFEIVLGDAGSASAGGAIITHPSLANIIIVDNDKSVIEFEQKRYYVNEPTLEEKKTTLTIPVLRQGDTSKTAFVTVFTKDGSARSGRHYQPMAKILEFPRNKTRVEVSLDVMYDSEISLRTAFSLHLHTDSDFMTSLGRSKTVVYIEEGGYRTGVTFPLNPLVVSLLNYDNMKEPLSIQKQGYPLICVAACNSKHPEYQNVKDLCDGESIEHNLTTYRWQVSAPSNYDGVSSHFNDVSMQLFFANPHRITLDSVYFSAGSRVRCVAKAFTSNGNAGIESFSEPVTIDPTDGLCMPRSASQIGAESFSAQVMYTGIKDKHHPNLMKLKVLVPHFDGLLPVISTKRLSNFELTLSPDASRVGQHKCSNLLDVEEVHTRYGFVRNISQHKFRSQPHEFDKTLRGSDTVRFYQNLNLDSCLWTFVSYYDMSELVQECGGSIVTDGMVKDSIQSHLVISIPLHVSYIYHSATDEDGWTDFNHHSSFRLSALYDTGVLWKDGVGLPEKAKLKGKLHPTSIIVRRSDKRLQVSFRTKARFKGLFILRTKAGRDISEVKLLGKPGMKFQLKLIRSDPTFAQPGQLWQLTSLYAVRDYSGSFLFKLIPCIVAKDEEYTWPPNCTPQEAVEFRLNMTIQQTSEPVQTTFSLNTRFHLLNSRQQWMRPNLLSSQVTDVSFKEGDKIYGRVMVDASQSLGSAYNVIVEKVFLCSGFDGYVPLFQPDQKQYGCIADSENLLYRFKILDRLNPETVEEEFNNVRFNALLADDDDQAQPLVVQSGSDGFSLDSTPLFKVSAGRSWFLHIIYTVRSQQNRNRGIGKRSIDEQLRHSMTSSVNGGREKRAVVDDSGVGGSIKSIGQSKGTNLQMILLDRSGIPENEFSEVELTEPQGKAPVARSFNLVLVLVISLLAVIIIAGFIGGFVFYKRYSTGLASTPQGTAI